MKYTYQTHSASGSLGCPEGTDVGYAANKSDLSWALEAWQDEHHQVGSDSADASLLVWKGELKDVQDLCPDFSVTTGPRGGIRFAPC